MKAVRVGPMTITLSSDNMFQIHRRQKNTWPGANPEVVIHFGTALSIEEIKALHDSLGQVIQWANTNWTA